MRVKIEFTTDNAAFVDSWHGQIQDIMDSAKDMLLCAEFDGRIPNRKLYDLNGNVVGAVTITRRPKQRRSKS